MLSLTYFSSRYDNATDKVLSFQSWNEFKEYCKDLSTYKSSKPSKDEYTRNSAPLISPARYISGSTRANSNVEYWDSWCALDVDEYEYSSLDNLRINYEAFVYSTASSRENNLKFRILFPLTEKVYKQNITWFWKSLVSEIGYGDQQVKDASRMYYVPGQYNDAYNFLKEYSGEYIDPNILMKKYSQYSPSEALNILRILPSWISEENEIHKKAKFGEEKKYTWTSIHDCPFVNSEYILEYKSISQTGWYAQMYKIMVSIASRAIKMGYNITSSEIAQLCRELDNETGNWYKSRPMEKEAQRAIDYAFSQS